MNNTNENSQYVGVQIDTRGMYRCCVAYLEEKLVSPAKYALLLGEHDTCPHCKASLVCVQHPNLETVLLWVWENEGRS